MHNTLPGDQSDHAFLYQDGTITNLGGLVAYTQSYANGINDSGTICGESIGPFGYSAVVWSNGQIAPLGLPVGPNSGAYDLSENGLICGYMGQGGTGASHAFVYDLTTGNAIDVGTQLPNTTNASATGVNSFGTVCGQSWIPCSPSCGVWRGFLWSDGVGFDLGVLSGMTRCNPNDVNDSNVVVGSSSPQTGNAKGFVWQSGVMYELNDVVPPELNLRILSASSINNAGQIAAHGFIVGGPNVALRLNPIPPQPGDATCDGFVNAADIQAVIAAWGDCPQEFTVPCPTDLNDDHRTGVPDLLDVINHWGQGNGQP
jgi:probable HAF family extracellular repeat protein